MVQTPFDLGREAFLIGEDLQANPFDAHDYRDERMEWKDGWHAAEAEAEAKAKQSSVQPNLEYIKMLILEAEQQGRHDAEATATLLQLLEVPSILIELEAGVVQSVYANREDVTVKVHDADETSEEEKAAHEKEVAGLVEVY